MGRLVTRSYDSAHKVQVSNKVKWEASYDANLLAAMEAQGSAKVIKWAQVCVNSGLSKLSFTPKQCRERWLNHLNPNNTKGPWSLQDDKVLVKLKGEYGKRWALIRQHLSSSRTNHEVKNRFYTLQRRGMITVINAQLKAEKNAPAMTMKKETEHLRARCDMLTECECEGVTNTSKVQERGLHLLATASDQVVRQSPTIAREHWENYFPSRD
jgi:hypothetical protein